MISAILLAAGESKRILSENKLIKSFKGKPLINHILESLIKSKVNKIIIVLGYEHIKIKKLLLKSKKITFTINRNYKRGISSSIKSGLKKIDKKNRGFINRLSDGGFKVVFLLRLNPLSSIDSISYFAGAMGMNVYKFMLSTMAGVTPLIVVGTLFGSKAIEKYNIGLELLVIFTFIYIANQLRKVKIVQKIKNARNNRLKRKTREHGTQ